VTAVVLGWNGRDDTLACLRSLDRATYPELSVVVVDNGSTDGGPDAVAAEFPEVTLIRLDENRGFAGGVNVGVAGALEAGASRGLGWVWFAPGTCAAFVGTSLLAWSVAAFSSRTATTIVWLLVLTIPAIARVVSPVQLLGTTWATADRFMLTTVCTTAIVAFAAATASVVRGSAPLEAAQ